MAAASDALFMLPPGLASMIVRLIARRFLVVAADNERFTAHEIRRVIAAACAGPARERRVRAQRTRLRHRTARGLRRTDLLRRLALLDPVDDGLEKSLWLRACAAAAMRDARCHEQS